MLEEKRAKEALALVQKKHMLIKYEGERERARTMRRLEESRGIVHGPEATTVLLWFLLIVPGPCFLQDGARVERRVSESSWTALARGRKETDGASTWKVKWKSWRMEVCDRDRRRLMAPKRR